MGQEYGYHLGSSLNQIYNHHHHHHHRHRHRHRHHHHHQSLLYLTFLSRKMECLEYGVNSRTEKAYIRLLRDDFLIQHWSQCCREQLCIVACGAVYNIETGHHTGTPGDYYYWTGPAVLRRLESLTAYRCHCNVGPDFLCRLYFKILWIKKSLLLLLLFVFHYVFCGIACEQQTYFRSSLLSLRKMTSDLIGQHQNKRFYVTEIVLPLGFADVNFSEGEKRPPEIRLLFAGYCGTDKDYFGGVDRYLGQRGP